MNPHLKPTNHKYEEPPSTHKTLRTVKSTKETTKTSSDDDASLSDFLASHYNPKEEIALYLFKELLFSQKMIEKNLTILFSQPPGRDTSKQQEDINVRTDVNVRMSPNPKAHPKPLLLSGLTDKGTQTSSYQTLTDSQLQKIVKKLKHFNIYSQLKASQMFAEELSTERR